jgi:hypothetical protein
MSKKFQEFLSQTEKKSEPKEEGVVADGAFVCLTCYYQCDEAMWFPAKKLLVWTCPEGHKSDIKDFKGF